MTRSGSALKFLMAGIIVLGLFASVHGDRRDALLAVVDREYALANPLLEDCPAYAISADDVLILISATVAGEMPPLAATMVMPAVELPMWVTPTPIPEEIARRPGLEILLTEGVNTVFAASEDAAYDLLAEGYFVVRVELRPLKRMQAAPWIKRMVEDLLERRPLDGRRAEFLRAMTDSVDSLRLKDMLHFLEYDDANSRYRSRFQVRPETRQEVVPYISGMLDAYVSPYGGDVVEQGFIQKLGGDFACTGEFPCDTVFVNIIATKPGRKTGAHYIICAHYDAIANRTSGWSSEWYKEGIPAPGGDDNGTGVAILLECARLLSGLDLDVGIKFIAFSGEELGLLGSDYYVANLAPEDSILGVLNVDMVGYVDESPLLEIIYDWNSKWIADQLEDMHGVLGLGFEVELFNLSGVGISDHANFWRIGIPGTMLIEELKAQGSLKGPPVNPYYHTVGDTSGILDMGMVRGAGRMVVGVIARFAEMPEDSLPDIWLTDGSIELDWEGRSAGMPPVAGDSLEVGVRALNVGGTMDQPEPYTLEVWQGRRNTGSLIYESTEMLQVGQGEHTHITFSWETDPDAYGDIAFTFVLLPVGDDAESDLDNNMVEVVLEIMPVAAMLRDLHVTPNPVSFAQGEPQLRFEILHPEGDFNAVMDVWVFDILGIVVGHASLEKTPLVHDFGAGENSVDLSRVVSTGIAPGLYICRTRLRLLGEPGTFDTKFKFAVDR